MADDTLEHSTPEHPVAREAPDDPEYRYVDEAWERQKSEDWTELDPGDWCSPQPADCSEIEHRWAISASRLNAFWSFLYPRLAARVWNPANGLGWPAANGQVINGWLINELPNLPVSTERFAWMRDDFVEYLRSDCPSMPIRLRGRGGYDFILSDQGMDLFTPPWPYQRLDLFRFYAHRSTGDTPMDIPAFRNDPSTLVNIDSPDGPSQVELPARAIVILYECAECSTPRGAHGVPQTKMTIGEYVFLMGRQRCWWLEGSVYRGILLHLPRVVATMWHELTRKCTARPSDYHQRYPNPLDDGLREIFRERMESSLPRYPQMSFEEWTGATPDQFLCDITVDVCGKDVTVPFWNARDVMITAKGMFFPEVDQASVPSRRRILTDIEEGRAGNPAFTSTQVCV